jgi:hypothetical protein
VIVTHNLKDFPSETLAFYGIEAQHPDEFLSHHLNLAPGIFCSSVQKVRRRLKNPPCKYPPAEPGALRCEPLKAAGAFVAQTYFLFGSCAHERLCLIFASLSGNSSDLHRLNHLCHSPTFKNRKPGHTPGNVKLLLPPRQSRGISHLVSILPASATRYIPPIAVDFCPIYTSYFGQSHHLSEICSVIRTNGSPWTISRCPLDHPGSHCRDASERVDSCRFPRSGPTGGSR